MKTDVAVVGGGVAGLAAALEAAQAGAQVHLIDEGPRPGGQLFKQIHKFFGSRRHYAGIRGITLGRRLVADAEAQGVHLLLNAYVFGMTGTTLGLMGTAGGGQWLAARTVILCCGASEKGLLFPGWTLPGVMGAGAAQTLLNVHRVRPGRRFLMVGSGNVGLVVAYQILQAGADVVAVVEALPHVGGWGVHAAKLRRCGVPLLTATTVTRAHGRSRVEAATLTALDDHFHTVPGTARDLDVDVICLAVGLQPNIELPLLAGCDTLVLEALGGRVPLHDANMETTQENIYVAGDGAGVEEASTALESGRLAGAAAAERLGYLPRDAADNVKAEIRDALAELRGGPFGAARRRAKAALIHHAQARRGGGATYA